jgi:hypothetical protein
MDVQQQHMHFRLGVLIAVMMIERGRGEVKSIKLNDTVAEGRRKKAEGGTLPRGRERCASRWACGLEGFRERARINPRDNLP